MKINEFTNPLKHYIATVRVVTGNGTMTARTSVTADTQDQARSILIRLYGAGNVFNVIEVMHESPRTDQIHDQATIQTLARQRKHPSKKTGPVELSCVSETEGMKRLSSAELQVKALADKAEDYKQQEKTMKARQQMAKAQQNLMKASRGSSAS